MSSTTSPSVDQAVAADAAELTLLNNRFAGIAEEMGLTLARTAYSPNIKERRDFSCAVFDEAGELVAQAAHIPVHLGAMPMSVRAAIDAFGKLHQGDVVMLNDPFEGGTHLPDITLVSPVFAPGDRGGQPRRVGYLASRAHHADVGGMSPGSLPLSREIQQEGLRLPPVKLHEASHENEAVMRILLANVRTPDERRGDLRAQLAAHRVGNQRLQEVVREVGRNKLPGKLAALQSYSRRLMEKLIEQIPDGQYEASDVLDDDGAGGGPIPIRVKLTVRKRGATVDFTGSAPACAGSLNAVAAITRSAVDYCFLCLLVTPWRGEALDAETTPPLNAGCFQPIRVHLPVGSVVHAQAPAAVAGGNVETSQRIVDTVFAALAEALKDEHVPEGLVPGVIPAASQGTMNNLTLGGTDPSTGKPWAYYETTGGGMGGRPVGPGLDAVQAHMTNTMNTPVEALEFAYPLRVTRYAIATGTGGDGRCRGGDGIHRELRLLAPASGAILSERRESQPYPLAGGEPGQVGHNTLLRADGRVERLDGKATLDLQPGDAIRIRTPGGGGYGQP